MSERRRWNSEQKTEEIRMLGTHMRNEHDTEMRVTRATKTWMQIQEIYEM